MDNENGVWRTVLGRKVFIEKEQSLSEAMSKSGEFDGLKGIVETDEEKEISQKYESASQGLQTALKNVTEKQKFKLGFNEYTVQTNGAVYHKFDVSSRAPNATIEQAEIARLYEAKQKLSEAKIKEGSISRPQAPMKISMNPPQNFNYKLFAVPSDAGVGRGWNSEKRMSENAVDAYANDEKTLEEWLKDGVCESDLYETAKHHIKRNGKRIFVMFYGKRGE